MFFRVGVLSREAQSTNNRAKYQRTTCFSLYFRGAAYPRPKVRGTNNRAEYKIKMFFLAFLRFFCIFALRNRQSLPPARQHQNAKDLSCSGRRKIFARPPQDIAPPAATICHGRGKLVTSGLAPCYIRSKSLLGRASPPSGPNEKRVYPHRVAKRCLYLPSPTYLPPPRIAFI